MKRSRLQQLPASRLTPKTGNPSSLRSWSPAVPHIRAQRSSQPNQPGKVQKNNEGTANSATREGGGGGHSARVPFDLAGCQDEGRSQCQTALQPKRRKHHYKPTNFEAFQAANIMSSIKTGGRRTQLWQGTHVPGLGGVVSACSSYL